MINTTIAFMVAASSERINTSIADGTVDRTALTGICVGMDTSATIERLFSHTLGHFRTSSSCNLKKGSASSGAREQRVPAA
jgi:hypothetical protein